MAVKRGKQFQLRQMVSVKVGKHTQLRQAVAVNGTGSHTFAGLPVFSKDQQDLSSLLGIFGVVTALFCAVSTVLIFVLKA